MSFCNEFIADNDKYEKSLIGKLRNEREEIQAKTYKNWINSVLLKARQSIDDIYTDLRSGEKLIILLELITEEKFARISRGQTFLHHIENVTHCLKFIKSKNVYLESIGPEDIVKGNHRLTLGLIWTIILRFHLSQHFNLAKYDLKSVKDSLLLWCQHKTKHLYHQPISDFHSSWRSGLAFVALVNSFECNLISANQIKDKTSVDILNIAFDSAYHHLLIPKILDAEDVDKSPDENSILTYISYYYNLFSRTKNIETGTKRIKYIITQLSDIENLQDNYKSMAKELLEWVEQKRTLFGQNVDIQQAHSEMDKFNRYFFTVRSCKSTLRNECESIYLQIVNSRKSVGLNKFMPESGHSVKDIEREWLSLEDAEKKRQCLLKELMVKFERLTRISELFETKSRMFESYVTNKLELLNGIFVAGKCSSVKELETHLKQSELICCDILANKVKFNSLLNILQELIDNQFKDHHFYSSYKSHIEFKMKMLSDLAWKNQNSIISSQRVLERLNCCQYLENELIQLCASVESLQLLNGSSTQCITINLEKLKQHEQYLAILEKEIIGIGSVLKSVDEANCLLLIPKNLFEQVFVVEKQLLSCRDLILNVTKSMHSQLEVNEFYDDIEFLDIFLQEKRLLCKSNIDDCYNQSNIIHLERRNNILKLDMKVMHSKLLDTCRNGYRLRSEQQLNDNQIETTVERITANWKQMIGIINERTYLISHCITLMQLSSELSQLRLLFNTGDQNICPETLVSVVKEQVEKYLQDLIRFNAILTQIDHLSIKFTKHNTSANGNAYLTYLKQASEIDFDNSHLFLVVEIDHSSLSLDQLQRMHLEYFQSIVRNVQHVRQLITLTKCDFDINEIRRLLIDKLFLYKHPNETQHQDFNSLELIDSTESSEKLKDIDTLMELFFSNENPNQFISILNERKSTFESEISGITDLMSFIRQTLNIVKLARCVTQILHQPPLDIISIGTTPDEHFQYLNVIETVQSETATIEANQNPQNLLNEDIQTLTTSTQIPQMSTEDPQTSILPITFPTINERLEPVNGRKEIPRNVRIAILKLEQNMKYLNEHLNIDQDDDLQTLKFKTDFCKNLLLNSQQSIEVFENYNDLMEGDDDVRLLLDSMAHISNYHSTIDRQLTIALFDTNLEEFYREMSQVLSQIKSISDCTTQQKDIRQLRYLKSQMECHYNQLIDDSQDVSRQNKSLCEKLDKVKNLIQSFHKFVDRKICLIKIQVMFFNYKEMRKKTKNSKATPNDCANQEELVEESCHEPNKESIDSKVDDMFRAAEIGLFEIQCHCDTYSKYKYNELVNLCDELIRTCSQVHLNRAKKLRFQIVREYTQRHKQFELSRFNQTFENFEKDCLRNIENIEAILHKPISDFEQINCHLPKIRSICKQQTVTYQLIRSEYEDSDSIEIRSKLVYLQDILQRFQGKVNELSNYFDQYNLIERMSSSILDYSDRLNETASKHIPTVQTYWQIHHEIDNLLSTLDDTIMNSSNKILIEKYCSKKKTLCTLCYKARLSYLKENCVQKLNYLKEILVECSFSEEFEKFEIKIEKIEKNCELMDYGQIDSMERKWEVAGQQMELLEAEVKQHNNIITKLSGDERQIPLVSCQKENRIERSSSVQQNNIINNFSEVDIARGFNDIFDMRQSDNVRNGLIENQYIEFENRTTRKNCKDEKNFQSNQTLQSDQNKQRGKTIIEKLISTNIKPLLTAELIKECIDCDQQELEQFNQTLENFEQNCLEKINFVKNIQNGSHPECEQHELLQQIQNNLIEQSCAYQAIRAEHVNSKSIEIRSKLIYLHDINQIFQQNVREFANNLKYQMKSIVESDCFDVSNEMENISIGVPLIQPEMNLIQQLTVDVASDVLSQEDEDDHFVIQMLNNKDCTRTIDSQSLVDKHLPTNQVITDNISHDFGMEYSSEENIVNQLKTESTASLYYSESDSGHFGINSRNTNYSNSSELIESKTIDSTFSGEEELFKETDNGNVDTLKVLSGNNDDWRAKLSRENSENANKIESNDESLVKRSSIENMEQFVDYQRKRIDSIYIQIKTICDQVPFETSLVMNVSQMNLTPLCELNEESDTLIQEELLKLIQQQTDENNFSDIEIPLKSLLFLNKNIDQIQCDVNEIQQNLQCESFQSSHNGLGGDYSNENATAAALRFAEQSSSSSAEVVDVEDHTTHEETNREQCQSCLLNNNYVSNDLDSKFFCSTTINIEFGENVNGEILESNLQSNFVESHQTFQCENELSQINCVKLQSCCSSDEENGNEKQSFTNVHWLEGDQSDMEDFAVFDSLDSMNQRLNLIKSDLSVLEDRINKSIEQLSDFMANYFNAESCNIALNQSVDNVHLDWPVNNETAIIDSQQFIASSVEYYSDSNQAADIECQPNVTISGSNSTNVDSVCGDNFPVPRYQNSTVLYKQCLNEDNSATIEPEKFSSNQNEQRRSNLNPNGNDGLTNNSTGKTIQTLTNEVVEGITAASETTLSCNETIFDQLDLDVDEISTYYNDLNNSGGGGCAQNAEFEKISSIQISDTMHARLDVVESNLQKMFDIITQVKQFMENGECSASQQTKHEKMDKLENSEDCLLDGHTTTEQHRSFRNCYKLLGNDQDANKKLIESDDDDEDRGGIGGSDEDDVAKANWKTRDQFCETESTSTRNKLFCVRTNLDEQNQNNFPMEFYQNKKPIEGKNHVKTVVMEASDGDKLHKDSANENYSSSDQINDSAKYAVDIDDNTFVLEQSRVMHSRLNIIESKHEQIAVQIDKLQQLFMQMCEQTTDSKQFDEKQNIKLYDIRANQMSADIISQSNQLNTTNDLSLLGTEIEGQIPESIYVTNNDVYSLLDDETDGGLDGTHKKDVAESIGSSEAPLMDEPQCGQIESASPSSDSLMDSLDDLDRTRRMLEANYQTNLGNEDKIITTDKLAQALVDLNASLDNVSVTASQQANREVKSQTDLNGPSTMNEINDDCESEKKAEDHNEICVLVPSTTAMNSRQHSLECELAKNETQANNLQPSNVDLSDSVELANTVKEASSLNEFNDDGMKDHNLAKIKIEIKPEALYNEFYNGHTDIEEKIVVKFSPSQITTNDFQNGSFEGQKVFKLNSPTCEELNKTDSVANVPDQTMQNAFPKDSIKQIESNLLSSFDSNYLQLNYLHNSQIGNCKFTKNNVDNSVNTLEGQTVCVESNIEIKTCAQINKTEELNFDEARTVPTEKLENKTRIDETIDENSKGSSTNELESGGILVEDFKSTLNLDQHAPIENQCEDQHKLPSFVFNHSFQSSIEKKSITNDIVQIKAVGIQMYGNNQNGNAIRFDDTSISDEDSFTKSNYENVEFLRELHYEKHLDLPVQSISQNRMIANDVDSTEYIPNKLIRTDEQHGWPLQPNDIGQEEIVSSETNSRPVTSTTKDNQIDCTGECGKGSQSKGYDNEITMANIGLNGNKQASIDELFASIDIVRKDNHSMLPSTKNVNINRELSRVNPVETTVNAFSSLRESENNCQLNYKSICIDRINLISQFDLTKLDRSETLKQTTKNISKNISPTVFPTIFEDNSTEKVIEDESSVWGQFEEMNTRLNSVENELAQMVTKIHNLHNTFTDIEDKCLLKSNNSQVISMSESKYKQNKCESVLSESSANSNIQSAQDGDISSTLKNPLLTFEEKRCLDIKNEITAKSVNKMNFEKSILSVPVDYTREDNLIEKESLEKSESNQFENDLLLNANSMLETDIDVINEVDEQKLEEISNDKVYMQLIRHDRTSVKMEDNLFDYEQFNNAQQDIQIENQNEQDEICEQLTVAEYANQEEEKCENSCFVLEKCDVMNCRLSLIENELSRIANQIEELQNNFVDMSTQCSHANSKDKLSCSKDDLLNVDNLDEENNLLYNNTLATCLKKFVDYPIIQHNEGIKANHYLEKYGDSQNPTDQSDNSARTFDKSKNFFVKLVAGNSNCKQQDIVYEIENLLKKVEHSKEAYKMKSNNYKNNLETNSLDIQQISQAELYCERIENKIELVKRKLKDIFSLMTPLSHQDEDSKSDRKLLLQSDFYDLGLCNSNDVSDWNNKIDEFNKIMERSEQYGTCDVIEEVLANIENKINGLHWKLLQHRKAFEPDDIEQYEQALNVLNILKNCSDERQIELKKENLSIESGSLSNADLKKINNNELMAQLRGYNGDQSEVGKLLETDVFIDSFKPDNARLGEEETDANRKGFAGSASNESTEVSWGQGPLSQVTSDKSIVSVLSSSSSTLQGARDPEYGMMVSKTGNSFKSLILKASTRQLANDKFLHTTQQNVFNEAISKCVTTNTINAIDSKMHNDFHKLKAIQVSTQLIETTDSTEGLNTTSDAAKLNVNSTNELNQQTIKAPFSASNPNVNNLSQLDSNSIGKEAFKNSTCTLLSCNQITESIEFANKDTITENRDSSMNEAATVENQNELLKKCKPLFNEDTIEPNLCGYSTFFTCDVSMKKQATAIDSTNVADSKQKRIERIVSTIANNDLIESPKEFRTLQTESDIGHKSSDSVSTVCGAPYQCESFESNHNVPLKNVLEQESDSKNNLTIALADPNIVESLEFSFKDAETGQNPKESKMSSSKTLINIEKSFPTATEVVSDLSKRNSYDDQACNVVCLNSAFTDSPELISIGNEVSLKSNSATIVHADGTESHQTVMGNRILPETTEIDDSESIIRMRPDSESSELIFSERVASVAQPNRPIDFGSSKSPINSIIQCEDASEVNYNQMITFPKYFKMCHPLTKVENQIDLVDAKMGKIVNFDNLLRGPFASNSFECSMARSRSLNQLETGNICRNNKSPSSNICFTQTKSAICLRRWSSVPDWQLEYRLVTQSSHLEKFRTPTTTTFLGQNTADNDSLTYSHSIQTDENKRLFVKKQNANVNSSFSPEKCVPEVDSNGNFYFSTDSQTNDVNIYNDSAIIEVNAYENQNKERKPYDDNSANMQIGNETKINDLSTIYAADDSTVFNHSSSIDTNNANNSSSVNADDDMDLLKNTEIVGITRLNTVTESGSMPPCSTSHLSNQNRSLNSSIDKFCQVPYSRTCAAQTISSNESITEPTTSTNQTRNLRRIFPFCFLICFILLLLFAWIMMLWPSDEYTFNCFWQNKYAPYMKKVYENGPPPL